MSSKKGVKREHSKNDEKSEKKQKIVTTTTSPVSEKSKRELQNESIEHIIVAILGLIDLSDYEILVLERFRVHPEMFGFREDDIPLSTIPVIDGVEINQVSLIHPEIMNESKEFRDVHFSFKKPVNFNEVVQGFITCSPNVPRNEVQIRKTGFWTMGDGDGYFRGGYKNGSRYGQWEVCNPRKLVDGKPAMSTIYYHEGQSMEKIWTVSHFKSEVSQHTSLLSDLVDLCVSYLGFSSFTSYIFRGY